MKGFLSALFSSKKTTILAVAGVGALLVVGAGVYLAFSSSSPFKKSAPTSKSSESKEVGCGNLNTSSWRTYKKGFTVKYPSNWSYKEEQPQAAATQWSVSFGPKNQTALVWIGNTAYDLSQFKQELTTTMVPGFDIEKEEAVTIDSRAGTKLAVFGHAASYRSYIYHVPFFNISYIFQGPAKDPQQFTNCEPEIYQKMLETFKFPTLPGGGGSGDQTYTNDQVDISFDYSSDWEVKSEYYYETAAGEKATVPTIILGRKSDPANATSNQISINLRQASCVGAGSVEYETAGSIKVAIYTLPASAQKCAEATVSGKDKNGKTTPYTFVSFFDDPIVKDVIIEVVKSFKATS